MSGVTDSVTSRCPRRPMRPGASAVCAGLGRGAAWCACLLLGWLGNAAARTQEVQLAASAPAAVVSPAQAAAAYERAAGIPHPRFFEGDASGRRLRAALAGQRAEGLRRMQAKLARHAGKGAALLSMVREQPSTRVDPHGAARVVTEMNRELNILPDYALVWKTTGNAQWRDELLQRLETAAAALDTVAARKDFELAPLRNLVWAIAFSLDLAYDTVPEALRRQCLESMGRAIARAGDGLIRDAGQPLPNNSRYHSLGRMCAAALLHAGAFDGDRSFIERCLPAYLNRLSPYGGDDGGQFDGTSYTVWGTLDSLFAWDVYKRVAGIDPYAIPWVRGVGEFFTYFVPPGAPAGAFGDGAEVPRNEEWARFAQLIAAREPTPLLRWSAANRSGADAGYLGMVLMPLKDDAGASFPAGQPDSRLFASVGWVAMHSALASQSRTSVLFKASPFGAVGHGHADQNSLVMSSGGERILIDSGVYDWYRSPHALEWYQQTRAHNAVTFDGGQGQVVGQMAPASHVHDFWDDGTVAAAVGDAPDAYPGGVQRARRSIAFVRPGTLLVRDSLRAEHPRAWELNFHSYRDIVPLGANSVRLPSETGREDVCIDVLDGPPMSEAISKGYPVDPDLKNVLFKPPLEHHVRFVAGEPMAEADVLTVVSIGCRGRQVHVIPEKDGGLRVAIGAQKLVFAADGRIERR